MASSGPGSRSPDRPSGSLDSRGARLAAVYLDGNRPVAFYDGRASAEENYEERTGIAVGDDLTHFTAVSDDVDLQSPWGTGGLRYLDIVKLPTGNYGFTTSCAGRMARTICVPKLWPAPANSAANAATPSPPDSLPQPFRY